MTFYLIKRRMLSGSIVCVFTQTHTHTYVHMHRIFLILRRTFQIAKFINF